MSETPRKPFLRLVQGNETAPIEEAFPSRVQLSSDEWTRMDSMLHDITHQLGGVRIGAEIVRFPADQFEQAAAMTTILQGIVNGDRRFYDGIAVAHVLLAENMEDPADTLPSTLFFPGTISREAIAARAGHAMMESNLLLEAVQSPLRFPEVS